MPSSDSPDSGSFGKLTGIELIGYKSFAGRTRLEFHDEITAIAGPNGSGKSNIVDAIKWVLGEQSMKKRRNILTMPIIRFTPVFAA